MTDIPDEAVEVAWGNWSAPLPNETEAEELQAVRFALTAALPILERAWMQRLAGEENPHPPDRAGHRQTRIAWSEGFAAGYAKHLAADSSGEKTGITGAWLRSDEAVERVRLVLQRDDPINGAYYRERARVVLDALLRETP